MSYRITTMTGRCRQSRRRGVERGGEVCHAVPDGPDAWGWSPALCGAKPGLRGNGWSMYPMPKVTCPRCLRKIAREAK